MDSSAAGEFLNSKQFIWGLFGGYMMALIGMIFMIPMLFIGSFAPIIVSIIWFFVEFLETINKLNGTLTVDSVSYRAGVKPIVIKWHINFVQRLEIKTDDLDISKTDEFIFEKDQEYKKIHKRVLIQLERLSDQQLSKETKQQQMETLIENEFRLPAGNDVKLYVYLVEMENTIEFPENDKQKYSKAVFVLKNSWSNTFPKHKDQIRYKSQLVNNALCYASMIVWDIIGADMPLAYCAFSDAEAYRETNKVVDAKAIRSGTARITDRLYFTQQAKYTSVDSVIDQHQQKISNLTDERNKLLQYNKMYAAKVIKTKQDIKSKKINLPKWLAITLTIVGIGLVGFLAYILGNGALGSMNPITNSTTGGF